MQVRAERSDEGLLVLVLAGKRPELPGGRRIVTYNLSTKDLVIETPFRSREWKLVDLPVVGRVEKRYLEDSILTWAYNNARIHWIVRCE